MKRNLYVLAWLLPMVAIAQPKGIIDVLETNLTSFGSVNTQSKVVRSGEKDIIIGWRSARHGVPYHNIYLQKVDQTGDILWEKDGVPLCPYAANQTEFAMVHDGHGGLVVVWEDYREGSDLPLLYAQRINALGEPLWRKEGLRICEISGAQRKPQIISDLNHGFYIVWEDYRGGFEDSDIYAQYVDLGGKSKWLPAGMPIVTAPNLQRNPAISCDENHFLYLIWEDFRSGVYWNLYVQKLDPDGNLSWKTDGLDVFEGAEENHQNAAMVPDGYGGMLFIYQKYSTKTHGTDIYRGRLSPRGEVVFHFATCFAPDEQQNPRIVKKGSRALVCWEDRRNGNWDLYAQMFRLGDGLIEWEINGLPVVKTSLDERNPVLIGSSSYGYQVFSWLRKEGDNYRIAVQKLDNQGEPAWEASGRAICESSHHQTDPSILADENGGLWCSWTDRRLEGSADIFVQHINGGGLPLLKAEGLRLGADHSLPYARVSGLQILASREGDFYLVWEDFRNGEKNSDIYIQKVAADGSFYWRTGGIPVCLADGDQNRPVLIEDGVGGILVAWLDRRNGRDDNIYAQRVSPWGKSLWQDDGVVVCDAVSDQNSLRGISDGKEGFVLCWVDARTLTETGFDLYIQRMAHDGAPLWTANGKPFAKFNGLQTSPSLAPDGAGGAYISWMDSRSTVTTTYVQHMDEFGMYEWEYGGRQVAATVVHQRQPEICRIQNGDLCIVWQDGRHGDMFEKLFMQCITTTGDKLWSSGGIHVCDYPGRQSKPTIHGESKGNFWVTWLDERSKDMLGFQLLCQKFNNEGVPQWKPGGVPVGEEMEEWNDYSIATNQYGYIYLAWNQTVGNGSKNVFCQKLEPNGTKKYENSGLRLGNDNQQQQSPVIAINLDGKGLIAWIQSDPNKQRHGIKLKTLI